jgi:hypothetical protein
VIRIFATESTDAAMLWVAEVYRQRFFGDLPAYCLAHVRAGSYPYGLQGEFMAIVAPHNLRRPDAGIQRPFGVRITLKPGDPFRKLLGADWNKTHWFGTAAERDAALIEMSRKHEYSRAGDKPALKFEKVEKLHESRGL